MDAEDFIIVRKKIKSLSIKDFDNLVSTARRRVEDLSSSVDDLLMGTTLGEKLVSNSSDSVVMVEDIGLEKTSLTEKQANEASRDPEVEVLRDMPVALVEPKSTAGTKIDTVGSAWGIEEVLGENPTLANGSDIKVAVLDTGILTTHPAFEGIDFVSFDGSNIGTCNVRNFTRDEEEDRNGHGTHCAGTIFGRNVNGKRIGVAPGVTDIMIGKVLDNDGRGSAYSVLEALKWVHSKKTNIVSMSLGFDFPLLQERLAERGNPQKLATSKALKAYRDNLNLFRTTCEMLAQETGAVDGTLMIAASGNESMRDEDPDYVIDVSVPAASSPHIVSVGAIQKKDDEYDIAPFSNINPRVCAPGVDILSASLDGGIRLDSGTSMACPHVAGIAALWWQYVQEEIGEAKASTVKARLEGNASLKKLSRNLSFADRGMGCVIAPQQDD